MLTRRPPSQIASYVKKVEKRVDKNGEITYRLKFDSYLAASFFGINFQIEDKDKELIKIESFINGRFLYLTESQFEELDKQLGPQFTDPLGNQLSIKDIVRKKMIIRKPTLEEMKEQKA